MQLIIFLRLYHIIVERVCKRFSEIVQDDRFWKNQCFQLFPWLFYTGSCEFSYHHPEKITPPIDPIHSLPTPDINELQEAFAETDLNDRDYPHISISIPSTNYYSSLHPIHLPNHPNRYPTRHDHDTHIKSPITPVSMSSSTHYPLKCSTISCTAHKIPKIPNVPNPPSNPTHFRQFYKKYMTQPTTHLFQVINSLVNRPMSVFNAVGTYYPHLDTYSLSYSPLVIAEFRATHDVCLYPQMKEDYELNKKSHHEDQDLNELDELLFPQEILKPNVNGKMRFRRIPELLYYHPERTPYFDEMYQCQPPKKESLSLLLSSCSIPKSEFSYRPFQIGDEVEIQWRMSNSSAFGWWRGYILSIIYRDRHQSTSSLSYPDIVVYFPQYPEGSIWYTITVSGDCEISPNIVHGDIKGYVGGIRKVNCIRHHDMWREWFSPA